MAFNKLDLTAEYIELPLGSKVYRIYSPSAMTGLQIQQINALALAARNGVELDARQAKVLQLDDQEEEEFYQRVLGDAFEEMLADGIPWERFKEVASTVMIWITTNVEAAEQFWNGLSAPKATPNRAARRAPAKKATARQTPSRASAGGTTRKAAAK